MTDTQNSGQLQSQTSIISFDKYQYDYSIIREKSHNFNDQFQNFHEKQSLILMENSLVNIETDFKPDEHQNLQKSNNMSKKMSQQSTQIAKQTSQLQGQNIKGITSLSKFFTGNKEKEMKIRIFCTERPKQNYIMKNSQISKKEMYFQNDISEAFKKNNQRFEYELEKQGNRLQNLLLKKQKIFSQIKANELKNSCMINLLSNKKTKTIQFSTKQNYCEQISERKQTKSMKKVAFQDLYVEQPKKGPKTCRKLSETSNKLDQSGLEASRQSLYQTKNSKYSKNSLKLTSQIGSFRMIKVVGPKHDTIQLMLKEVQIKNQQIERRQQHLFKISNENKHPNILRIFSKNKIFRENKIYLQFKMQFYETDLVNYLIQNEQSPFGGIQRKIILFQIIKGLNFLHFKKIYHRDLNPFNVLIGEKLRVFLTNFTFLQNPQNGLYSQRNYYQCNSFIRPPQIILNPLKPFDQGGDVWAVGCIIVFMLRGDMPFIDYSDADLILQMIKFLGKPSKQFLQSIDFKSNRRFNFEDQPLLSMRQFFNCTDDYLLDLLQSIFKFQSQKRQKTQNLLASKYFDELRDQVRFRNLEKQYNIANLFDFSYHQLQKNKLARIVPAWYKKK